MFLRLNNEIDNDIGAVLFFGFAIAVVIWYNRRLKKWRRARESQDGSEHARRAFEALQTRVNWEGALAIPAILVWFYLLDLIF